MKNNNFFKRVLVIFLFFSVFTFTSNAFGPIPNLPVTIMPIPPHPVVTRPDPSDVYPIGIEWGDDLNDLAEAVAE